MPVSEFAASLVEIQEVDSAATHENLLEEFCRLPIFRIKSTVCEKRASWKTYAFKSFMTEIPVMNQFIDCH